MKTKATKSMSLTSKKLYFLLVFILFHSCTERTPSWNNFPEGKLNIIENTAKGIEVNFKQKNLTFSYKANEKNNTTTESVLKIYDAELGSNPVSEITFIIDVSQTAYKLIQHKKVINESQRLSSDFKKIDMAPVLEEFEVFGKLIVNSPDFNISSQLVQSLFFHNAILNTISRKKTNKEEDCGCTPYNPYFVEKSPFWCQEDFFVSPIDIINKTEATGYKLDENGMKAYEFLKANRHLSKISIDKVYNAVIPKETFNKQVLDYYNSTIISSKAKVASCSTDCWLGLCGNQWGCCGNYSGCCWLATWQCFWHDIECLRCNHWHCGPACKPG